MKFLWVSTQKSKKREHPYFCNFLLVSMKPSPYIIFAHVLYVMCTIFLDCFRFGSLVDATDPLHDDEVCLVRENRGAHLQARRAETACRVQQRRAAGRDVRGRLHRRRVLRHRQSSRRHPGVENEPTEGRVGRRDPHKDRAGRDLEGPDAQDHHDRHSDGHAVVHLRRFQGRDEDAQAAAAGDARVAQEEAGGAGEAVSASVR